jgi:hypothetical protein
MVHWQHCTYQINCQLNVITNLTSDFTIYTNFKVIEVGPNNRTQCLKMLYFRTVRKKIEHLATLT